MVQFVAFIFEGKRSAQKVLFELEDSSNDYPWIDDVAVVSRDKLGHLRIHSTWAQDNMGEQGLGWGAITGAILGSLAAPASALAGAALGGSMWGLFGTAMDDAFNDPDLDKFGAKLEDDSSALVLVGNEKSMSEYEVAMAPYGGVIFKTGLDKDDIDYINKKINKKKGE